MQDLPRLGIEPVSLVLQGRFLTTGPPGKPLNHYFLKFMLHAVCIKGSFLLKILKIFLKIFPPPGELHVVACGILVPQPWNQPMPSAVEVWTPSHWTASEFPTQNYLSHLRLKEKIF